MLTRALDNTRPAGFICIEDHDILYVGRTPEEVNLASIADRGEGIVPPGGCPHSLVYDPDAPRTTGYTLLPATEALIDLFHKVGGEEAMFEAEAFRLDNRGVMYGVRED